MCESNIKCCSFVALHFAAGDAIRQRANALRRDMSFLRKLFGKNQDPEFDLEKAVGDYLFELPRCGKDVVVVSPEYGETYYTCKIIVAAADLLPWAEHHANAVWSLNQEEQAARKALPLWLRSSEPSSNSASYVPHFIYEVLRPYVFDFVHEGKAKIFCLECQSLVADAQMEN